MRQLGCVVVMMLLAACGGGVHGDDFTGRPFVVIHGMTGSTQPILNVRSPRATLMWQVYTNEMLDCLIEGNPLHACAGVSITASGVRIDPQFPSSFELELDELPSTDLLNGKPGSYLGIAGLAVYDDANDNGQLDLVARAALSSPDVPLGTSDWQPAPQPEWSTPGNYIATNQLLIYREGKLHEWWNYFYDVNGQCPEPPQGFSAVELGTRVSDDPECAADYNCPTRLTNTCRTLDLEAEPFNVNLDPQDPILRELVCPSYEVFPWAPQYPETEPPAGADILCSDDGLSMWVKDDPALYCDINNHYTLALYDWYHWTWDLTNDPPPWWPCTTS